MTVRISSPKPAGTAVAGHVLTPDTFSSNTLINAVGSMPNNGAVVITPNATVQTIPAGYHNGSGTVASAGTADPNNVAGNIRQGVTNYGVAGTFTGNATASAATILTGYTAGVNGGMVTGAAVEGVLIAGTQTIVENAGTYQTDATNGVGVYYRLGSRFTMKQRGVVRCSMSLESVTGNSTVAYAVVYKNGVQVGTVHSTTLSASFTVFTDDIAVSVGDYLEVWGQGVSGGSYAKINDWKLMADSSVFCTVS